MNTNEATSPTEPHTVIRAARTGDADSVFALVAQLERGIPTHRDEFDRSFTTCLRSAEPTFLRVLEHEGAVRGYAVTSIMRPLYANGTSGFLQEIVVDGALRGRGFGRLLVQAVEDECRNRGVAQLTVASVHSAGFYETMGYVRTADFLLRPLGA